jgi:predicted nucleic acid-binding protein
MKLLGASSVSDGLLDTNVVIHSLMSDIHAEECRAFLDSLEVGQRRVGLEPYVVHEITYVMSRRLKFAKDEIVSILLRMVQWSGIECDRELLNRALLLWRDRAGLSFIDALLASQAVLSQTRVFTINVKDFDDVGIEVPKPLSNYSTP